MTNVTTESPKPNKPQVCVFPMLAVLLILMTPGAHAELGDPRYPYPPLRGAVVFGGEVLDTRVVPDPRGWERNKKMGIVRIKVEKVYRGSLPDTITLHSLNIVYSEPGSTEIRFRAMSGAPVYQEHDKVLLIVSKYKFFDEFVKSGYESAEYVSSWERFLPDTAAFSLTDKLFKKNDLGLDQLPTAKPNSNRVTHYNELAKKQLVSVDRLLGEEITKILAFYNTLREEDQE